MPAAVTGCGVDWLRVCLSGDGNQFVWVSAIVVPAMCVVGPRRNQNIISRASAEGAGREVCWLLRTALQLSLQHSNTLECMNRLSTYASNSSEASHS